PLPRPHDRYLCCRVDTREHEPTWQVANASIHARDGWVGSAVEVAQGAAALVAGLGLRGRRAGLAAGGGLLPGAGGRAAGRAAAVSTCEPSGRVELRERLLRLRGGHRAADTDRQTDQAEVPREVVGPTGRGGCGDREGHHEDQQRGGRDPEADEHQPLVVLDLLLRQRHVRRPRGLGGVVAARVAVATGLTRSEPGWAALRTGGRPSGCCIVHPEVPPGRCRRPGGIGLPAGRGDEAFRYLPAWRSVESLCHTRHCSAGAGYRTRVSMGRSVCRRRSPNASAHGAAWPLLAGRIVTADQPALVHGTVRNLRPAVCPSHRWARAPSVGWHVRALGPLSRGGIRCPCCWSRARSRRPPRRAPTWTPSQEPPAPPAPISSRPR